MTPCKQVTSLLCITGVIILGNQFCTAGATYKCNFRTLYTQLYVRNKNRREYSLLCTWLLIFQLRRVIKNLCITKALKINFQAESNQQLMLGTSETTCTDKNGNIFYFVPMLGLVELHFLCANLLLKKLWFASHRQCHLPQLCHSPHHLNQLQSEESWWRNGFESYHLAPTLSHHLTRCYVGYLVWQISGINITQ